MSRRAAVAVLFAGLVLGFAGGVWTGGAGWFGTVREGDHAPASPTDASAGLRVDREPTAGAVHPDGAAPALDPDLAATNAALQRRIESLEREIAEARNPGDAPPRDRKGALFTFGETGRLSAIAEADWPEMARASEVIGAGLLTARRHTEAGEPVPRALMMEIQENTERVRRYEYRTIDRIPTAARHNGELTHPVTLANLVAAVLADRGLPLSPGQIESIDRLGRAFDEQFARTRDGWGPDKVRVRRVLEEYRLKVRFTEDLFALLSPEQSALVVDPAARGLAGLDLYDPTLMVLHTSPVVSGSGPAEVRTRLLGMLRQKTGGREGAEDPAIARLLDTFLVATEGLLTPVPRAAARYYSTSQADLAGRATVDLVEGILRDVQLTPDLRAALSDDPTWYVPRIVTG